MKVLLVSLYFPPAGGGGVQRPLKLATHLPELGHRDARARPRRPALAAPRRRPAAATAARPCTAPATSGRAGGKLAEELHGSTGLRRELVRARALGRRLLVPDENVTWNLTANRRRDPARSSARGSTS